MILITDGNLLILFILLSIILIFLYANLKEDVNLVGYYAYR